VGQVLNSKGTSVYGIMISWRNALIYGKEHNWSHSAIITDVSKEKILIHEALARGFVTRVYEKSEVEEKLKEKSFVLGETNIKLKDVRKNAKEYQNRGYGFFDIFHILLYWIFKTKAKFLFTHAKYLICSEAVARILYDSSNGKIDFQKEFSTPYDLIEPMHLWRSKQIKWMKN